MAMLRPRRPLAAEGKFVVANGPSCASFGTEQDAGAMKLRPDLHRLFPVPDRQRCIRRITHCEATTAFAIEVADPPIVLMPTATRFWSVACMTARHDVRP